MSANSNANGRAFEAIVFHDLANKIKERKIDCQLTERAYTSQINDMIFFNDLSDSNPELKKDYINNVHIITNWIFNTFDLEKCDSITLDKLPDSAGGDGDVTDIRITTIINGECKEINLSLKNNSNALKHSRIKGVPTWLGFDEDSDESIKYVKEYKEIWDNITDKIQKHNNTSINKIEIYKDLDYIYKGFKKKEIYTQYYALIEKFFNDFCSTRERTNELFRYLIGKIEYYKIINKPKYIHIAKYADIESPTSVKFERNKNDYLLLNFDNNWKISIRLHNGDNKLTPKLKVDAEFDSSFKVPEFKIKK